MPYRSITWANGEQDETTEETMPAVDLFDVLSNRHRRCALSYLVDHDDPITVDSLVDHVAAEANTADERTVTRTNVATMFHHCHLPKMADAEVIEYDRERGVVEMADRGTSIDPSMWRGN